MFGACPPSDVSKDSNRVEPHPHVSFTFLGFTFRPRQAHSSQGRLFTSFLPAASTDASKRMRQAVRGWRLNRQTHVALTDLAKLYNPVMLGWWNYYGAFYKTAMQRIFQHITLGPTQVEGSPRAQATKCRMVAEDAACLPNAVSPLAGHRAYGWMTEAV